MKEKKLCFGCGKPGHQQRDCLQEKKKTNTRPVKMHGASVTLPKVETLRLGAVSTPFEEGEMLDAYQERVRRSCFSELQILKDVIAREHLLKQLATGEITPINEESISREERFEITMFEGDCLIYD
jgi:hypothetical protein